MNSNLSLMDCVTKMEPLEFAGLAKLLGVAIVEDNPDKEAEQKVVPRSFTDVFADVMAKFDKLGRSKKREIIKLVKKSNSMKRGHE